MAARWIDMVTGTVEGKKRWRYKARTKQLPPNYRATVEAIERYLMYFVPASADSAASMFEDLAGLFEQVAADGTPIHEVVGQNPVEFVEAFAQNYSKGGYVPTRERERLISAIDRAAGNKP